MITAGPYISFALSGKESGTWITLSGLRPYNGKLYINNSPLPNTDHAQVKTTDFGINCSIAFQYDHIGVMLNWQKGLKNIITSIPFSYGNDLPNARYKNNSLELAVFYQFNLQQLGKRKALVKCPPPAVGQSKTTKE